MRGHPPDTETEHFMNKLEIFRNIAAEVHRRDLNFPTSVDAALQIQRALDDPDCHMQTAARLVSGEPLLAARAVAVANSVPYNRAGTEISSVQAAVTRLGFRTLRSLAASQVVRQFAGRVMQPALRPKVEQMWEHTVHVAALAQAIARRVTPVDPETAMFAGIVHEVGGFYLLSCVDDFPGLLDGDPEDWATYGQTLIGRGMFKVLSVPQSVVDSVEVLWHGGGKLPPQSLGDILQLAKSLAPVPSPLPGDAASRIAAPAGELAIGQGSLCELLEESDAEVQSLVAAMLR